MNRGLLIKAVCETRLTILLFGAGLLVFHAVLAAVLPSLFQDVGQFLDLPFFRNLIRGLLGPIGDNIGPGALLSLACVHPVVLTLVWAHEIMFCTRIPVAEIDRGTIDILLSLPVSRWQVYRTETLVWLGLFGFGKRRLRITNILYQRIPLAVTERISQRFM